MTSTASTVGDELVSPIRSLLDTCVVRRVLHDDGQQLDLAAIRESGATVEVSLPDTAAVELASQLLNKQIPFDDWARGIRDIDQIIDRKLPIFPSGRTRYALAGLTKVDAAELREDQRQGQFAWELLTSIDDQTQTHLVLRTEVGAGEIWEMSLNALGTSQTFDRIRSSFAEMIEDCLKQFSGNTPTLDEVTSFVLPVMQHVTVSTVEASQKLDLFLRVFAQFVQLAANVGSPYDPRSDKRRGDAFDIMMLPTLSVPTIVVTADQVFLNRISSLNSPQKSQVISVEEFNDRVRAGSLHTLLLKK